jgi:CRP-like cAMP-binding protein
VINTLRPGTAALELLLRKLKSGPLLRPDGVAPFGRLGQDLHVYEPGAWLWPPDKAPAGSFLVASGFVGEARVLGDGRRQITAVCLPGDLVGAGATPAYCAAVALSRAQTVDAAPVIRALTDASPRFDALRAAWEAAGRDDQARLVDHIVRLGRLSAYERTAHFLLELHERLLVVGLAEPDRFHMPLTQEVLADILGLSIVHVNRTLQQLRREALITYRSGQLVLVDPLRLAMVAGRAPLAAQRRPASASPKT